MADCLMTTDLTTGNAQPVGVIAEPVVNYTTNVTDLTAKKCGHIVELIAKTGDLTVSANAWTLIDTLDADLRPSEQIYFVGYDNKVSSDSMLQFRIAADGKLSVWSCSRTTLALRFTFTYIVD